MPPKAEYQLLRLFATQATPEGERFPSLQEIAHLMGWSMTRVREELAVAKALGVIEAKPRVGLRRLPYRFAPAVWLSLQYALELEQQKYFAQFADLRRRLEAAYFHDAVKLLTEEDKNHLQQLIATAQDKLHRQPPLIPHEEHRELHLTIYKRLNNTFVNGLLEAYWNAYEIVGLSRYSSLDYLSRVWEYHSRIVEGIVNGDYDSAYQALVEHTKLLADRPVTG